MALNKNLLFNRIYQEGLYDDFVNFAIYMRLTKGYSFFNSALILLQRPGALYVESENVWEKRFSRFVLPNATPIVIMQPFGPVNFIYDFADTYGEKAPKYMRDSFKLPRADTKAGDMLPHLIMTVKQLGIYYNEKSYGSRQGGQAEFLENAIKIKVLRNKKEMEISTHLAIIINKSSEDGQKAVTILHEIGHILCGHLPIDEKNKILNIPDRKKENLSEEQEEFEAEKVAELICKTIGIDYCNRDYLDGYKVDGEDPSFPVRVVIEAADKFITLMNS